MYCSIGYRHEVDDLMKSGGEEAVCKGPRRFASAASAKRVVQQPATMPGMQCVCSCGASNECEAALMRKCCVGEVGGVSSASAALAATGASSTHCRTSSSMPFSSATALASKSFHRPGPQKGSSSNALFMTWNQKSNMGRWEVLRCWRREDESRQATKIMRMVGSAWIM